MKKFFQKVEAKLKALFGSSTWEKTASTTLLVVTPIVSSLLTLAVGPAAGAAASAILSGVQQKLAAAAVIIDDLDAAGRSATGVSQVVNILGAAKADLASILQLDGIKNSGKVTEITSAVNTIVDELDAIVAAAPTVTATPIAAAPAVAKA